LFHQSNRGGGATYNGVVSLVLRVSSRGKSTPSGLKLDSRANRTSVEMCSRDFVAAKMFWLKPPFLIGRLRKKKMHIEKNRTFSPRAVASDRLFVGGRVRMAVLTAR
jgi:hypothetical protein